jgi:hypothetical protein
MKKIFTISIFLCAMSLVQAQATVEKHLLGLDVGLVSASFKYETKLARKFTLYTEAGISLKSYTVDYSDPALKDETNYLTSPFLAVAPRFYYGLDRRVQKGRNIAKNGANFISVNFLYNSNQNEITNSSSRNSVVPSLSVIPSFGIRRVFSSHFSYEFIFGYGYQYNFYDAQVCNCSHDQSVLDIQAKIGYNF